MQSDKIIEKIRCKLRESNPDNRTVLNVLQFHLTDSEGQLIKSVVFDFKELNIYDGKCSQPEAEITISDGNFFLVGSKQTTFDELIAENKVKVEGDMEALNKMLDKIRASSKN